MKTAMRNTEELAKTGMVVLAFLLCSGAASNADLVWGNGGAITNERGAAVASSRTDCALGSFAQLIWAGPNETADAFVRSDTGLSGDDTVVATVFSAEDFFAAPAPGIFPMRVLALNAADSNKVYYVRVFNASNPDYSEGVSAPAPLRATYFWQSEPHAYQYSELLDDHWDFAPVGGRTLMRGMIASNDVPVWWLVEYRLTNDYDTAALGNQDGDAFPTDQEWIADTDPTDSNSCFRITDAEYGPPLTVHFESSAARLYNMLRATSLSDNDWTNVPGLALRPGVGGMDYMRDTNAPMQKSFYRLKVEIP
jgi:hypothetical protein